MQQMLVEVCRAWLESERDLSEEDALAYLVGWGREGDRGIVLESEDGEPIGAAWMRLFSYDAPGLAFVTPSVPEVVFAVAEAERGKGHGLRMLESLLLIARSDKCPFVSVAVPRESPARRLAEKLGFADAGLSDEEDPLAILLGCL